MEFHKEKIFVMGEPVFFWREKSKLAELDGFRIEAKKSGVLICGGSLKLEAQEDLETFAKAVGEAWQQHQKLVPKLVDVAGNES